VIEQISAVASTTLPDHVSQAKHEADDANNEASDQRDRVVGLDLLVAQIAANLTIPWKREPESGNGYDKEDCTYQKLHSDHPALPSFAQMRPSSVACKYAKNPAKKITPNAAEPASQYNSVGFTYQSSPLSANQIMAPKIATAWNHRPNANRAGPRAQVALLPQERSA
jgi:hypothetical protein